MIARVLPPDAPLSGLVDPPSSKNYTTRYVIASCLAHGHSTVVRPAVHDDAEAMLRCCRRLGATITAYNPEGAPIEFKVANADDIERLEVDGFGNSPTLQGPEPLDTANAGAVLRLLLGIGALLPEVTFVTSYPESLGKRPNTDLLTTLAQLGVEVESEEGGRLPIHLKGGLRRIRSYIREQREAAQLAPDEPFPITVYGSISSQFTSAILFMTPLLEEPIRVTVTGRIKSRPLIETTRDVLHRAGIEVDSTPDRREHVVRAGQRYEARHWITNGDWPGASALFAAAAVVPGSSIELPRLMEDEQGERLCLEFYRAMGCEVERQDDPATGTIVRLRSGENLQASTINGDLCTDAVLALMSAAMVADGASEFYGIRNLQFKECDRIREPLKELRAVYATALPAPDGSKALPPKEALFYETDDDPETIVINGWPPGFEGGIEVDSHGDHRVIMMLSVVALRCRKGLAIRNAHHIAKSFPGWFRALRTLGAKVELT